MAVMPVVRELLTIVDEPTRSCGECSACCTVLGVVDLEPPKPDYTRCVDCRPSGGCARYDTRPPTCAGYVCGWLHGWGADEDRPDKLGLILEPWNKPADGGGPGVIAREVRPGAFETRAAGKLLEPIRLRTLIYVIMEGGKRMCVGPEGRLRAIEAIVERGRAKV